MDEKITEMPLPHGCLLIVDDEEDIRDILPDILKPIAKSIKTAANGKEAVALVKAGGIDAILSDINMPVMDGLEMLHSIRELGMETPVVFITGYADKDTAIEALRLGATDFLEKPFENNKVIEVASKVLLLAQALREVEIETEDLYKEANIPVDKRHQLRKMKQSILLMAKTAKIYGKKS